MNHAPNHTHRQCPLTGGLQMRGRGGGGGWGQVAGRFLKRGAGVARGVHRLLKFFLGTGAA